MSLRGLLCHPWGVGLAHHRPERVWMLGYRCRECGATAETELELMGDEDGRVPVVRLRFERPARYRREVA